MSAILFDRNGATRKDATLLAALEEHADTRFVPLWRNRVLLQEGDVARFSRDQALGLLPHSPAPLFLGRRNGVALFGLDVNPAVELQPLLDAAVDIADLRMIGATLHPADLELLSLARGMMLWHRGNRYCGRCAGAMRRHEGGHVLCCTDCQRKVFPRSDPAIMALIVHRATTRENDRCFIARQPAFPPGMFSVLAGFVEPGESVEDAVRREVLEESGLHAENIRYLRSQAWPYPASLMLGYQVECQDDQFELDNDELEEGRWVSRKELRDPEGFFIPPPYSLANFLLCGFRDDTLQEANELP